MTQSRQSKVSTSRRRLIKAALAGIVAPAVLRIGPAFAAYPDRPVRIVVAKATHGKVPDLVGLTLVKARTMLMKRGLVPVIESGTSRSDESVVRAQFPRAGDA